MPHPLPQYFFRVREGDIAVFLVDTQNPQRRINMKFIASVDPNSGNATHQGFRILSKDELDMIEDWLQAREARANAPHEPIHDIYNALDQLNRATQWAYNEASEEDIAAMIDPLMLAMHDLRNILVYKQAEALKKKSETK